MIWKKILELLSWSFLLSIFQNWKSTYQLVKCRLWCLNSLHRRLRIKLQLLFGTFLFWDKQWLLNNNIWLSNNSRLLWKLRSNLQWNWFESWHHWDVWLFVECIWVIFLIGLRWNVDGSWDGFSWSYYWWWCLYLKLLLCNNNWRSSFFNFLSDNSWASQRLRFWFNNTRLTLWSFLNINRNLDDVVIGGLMLKILDGRVDDQNTFIFLIQIQKENERNELLRDHENQLLKLGVLAEYNLFVFH